MAAVDNKGKVDHLGVVTGLLHVAGKTTLRAYTSPFIRKRTGGPPSYRRDVLYEMLRNVVSDFDPHQGQWILPGTDAVYKYTARRKKWKRNTVDLEHGAKGHWLGHSDAKYVLVYFHGGGYLAPCTPGHMKYQFAIQKYLRKQGIDISVLSLSYVLAPHVLHPAFIKQGLTALKYLIEKTNRDPSTILLGGDSAGGNLVANLLLHLGHPHPDCEQYNLSKRLKGALMISPWISFDTTSPSMETNKRSDCLTTKALKMASAAFIGPDAEHDAYSQPVDAPVEWWKEVADKVVEDVMVWGGGGEVLIDGIKKFASHVISGFEEQAEEKPVTAETIAANGTANGTANGAVASAKPWKRPRVKFVVSPHEAHEEMILDYLFYIKKEGDGGRQVKKWFVNILKTLPPAPAEPTAAEVREEVTEKKEGIADTETTIKKAEEAQEQRELAEEEKKEDVSTAEANAEQSEEPKELKEEKRKDIVDTNVTAEKAVEPETQNGEKEEEAVPIEAVAEKAEESQEHRALVEEEKKKAAEAVAPIA